MTDWSPDLARKTYSIPHWADGYFDVDAQGRIVVRPKGGEGTGLLLARAANEAQAEAIGRQTGGRVGFFLHTDDFEHDFSGFVAAGVRFLEQPRTEAYGTVAVFEDPFGNKWDLLQPAR